MNINFKQSQFELFPGTPGSSSESGKPRYLFANVSLSLENLIVFSIVILMILVFSFSLGVERGKKVGRFAVLQNESSKDIKLNPSSVSAGNSQKSLAGSNTNVRPQEVNPSGIATPQKAAGSDMEKNPNSVQRNQPPSDKTNTMTPGQDIKKSYTIQVASFKIQEYALKEAQDLKNKGHDILVLGKGEHFIVCVGKFVSEQEAKIFAYKLKKQYKDCLVRRL